MRTLNQSELLNIAGAALTADGQTIVVPNNGIPGQDFQNIEYALQMGIDGVWDESQIEKYLVGNGSIQYVETYVVSMFEVLQA